MKMEILGLRSPENVNVISSPGNYNLDSRSDSRRTKDILMPKMNRNVILASGFFYAGLLVSGLAMPRFASAKDLLYLDFNDTVALGKQPAPLPAAHRNGDVTPSRDFPGSADLKSSGFFSVDSFPSPRGPFSVEARFLIRNYAPESSRFINDILNTSTWDIGPTQGFVIRNGGSYLYPPLPRNAFATDAEYQASMNGYSYIERAVLSKCVGEFVMADYNDDRNWKNVYTDRCLQLNAWTHMVGVWDGKDMRIYLNGWEATDVWRVQGADVPTRMDSLVTAYVGARTSGSFDSRHTDGLLDFVRVVDYAMTPEEINQRYRTTSTAVDQVKICDGSILPINPKAGECAKKETEFRFQVKANDGCTLPPNKGYHKGDTVEVEFSKDAEFSKVFMHKDVVDTAFHFDVDKLPDSDKVFVGGNYWRARLKHSSDASGLTKRAATADLPTASPGPWSNSRPIVLDLASGTTALRRAGSQGSDLSAAAAFRMRQMRVLVIPQDGLFLPGPSDLAPTLYSLSGEKLSLPWQKRAGGWWLPTGVVRSGLLLAR